MFSRHYGGEGQLPRPDAEGAPDTGNKKLSEMGMYWLKNRRSREEMERELLDLRKKNLKMRLDLYVLVLTPDSRRAKRIKEEQLIKSGAIGSKVFEQPKGQPAEVFFR